MVDALAEDPLDGEGVDVWYAPPAQPVRIIAKSDPTAKNPVT